MTDVARMLAEKTRYSIFMPDLVLSTLLPDHFPPWKQCVQLESLQWIVKSTQRFFKNRRCCGCIVHADNQLLHEREIKDSKHVTLWACAVLQSGIGQTATSNSLFAEVAVPVLRNVAFRGSSDNLVLFLEALRNEFEQAAAALHINPTWLKHEAVIAINTFETSKLARSARCASARVLAQHAVLFGGMVYASAFALAFLRILWMDRKTQLLTKIGVLPRFPAAVTTVHAQ